MAAVRPIPDPTKNVSGRRSLALNLIKIAILVVLVGGSIYLLAAHRQWFEDPQLIKGEVLEWGIWGPIAFILLYAFGPSFLVPGAVMTIAGGLAFGTWWGSLWALIGADLGAVIAFGAGRFLGKAFVQSLVPDRFHHMMEKIARHGFFIILYLRIVPVIPYNALNLLAGASPIGFRDYFWASMIGMVPSTIVFAFLGDALWHPLSPKFFIALALIGLSVVCGEAYRRLSHVSLES